MTSPKERDIFEKLNAIKQNTLWKLDAILEDCEDDDPEIDYYSTIKDFLMYAQQNGCNVLKFDTSSVSKSCYVEIEIELEEGEDEIFDIRFSDHDSKPYHTSPDYNYQFHLDFEDNYEKMIKAAKDAV